MSTHTTPAQHSWLTVLSPRISGRELALPYRTSTGKAFTLTFRFNRDIAVALAPYPAAQIQRLLYFLALGSAIYLFNEAYFTEIHTEARLSKTERDFFEDFYFQGMAEFRLTNNIPLHTRSKVICAQSTNATPSADVPQLAGALVANGGGKDGAVGSEAIANAVGAENTCWFTWNLQGSRPLILAASPIRNSLNANSSFDPSPYHNVPYSGHKPLNGTLAFLVTLAALIEGKKYAVVSNEYSASEANMVREGIEINHQYTKSFAVEQQLRRIISGLGLGVEYFSILRPLYELQIMRILQDFPTYHRAFVSCNQGAKSNQWCLACAKCAFIVLSLSALNPDMVANIWGDARIIAKPELRQHVLQLVAKHLDKPFECVGTLDECQLSLGLMASNTTFWRSLPADFRKQLAPHIPANMSELERRILGTFNRENNIPPELQPTVTEFFAQHLRLPGNITGVN